jgi:hypothetical protein
MIATRLLAFTASTARAGTVSFTDFLLSRTHRNTAFEGEDEDGYLQHVSFRDPAKATPALSRQP